VNERSKGLAVPVLRTHEEGRQLVHEATVPPNDGFGDLASGNFSPPGSHYLRA
jgi:hypothetical protein